MPRRRRPGFIWIARDRPVTRTITINGVDVSDRAMASTFKKGIIGEDQGCELQLQNSDGIYDSLFTFGHVIQLKYDFDNGNTIQWEGELEEQRKTFNEFGHVLEVKGSHYSMQTLDKTVSATFSEALASDILTEIVEDNLTGFTTNNVNTSSTTVNITWNNKPLFDCIRDLMGLAEFDCYVDEDKDFHFFAKESIVNNNEAVVWNDNLIELRGLGQDSVDVRNRTIVFGESDGLPVIYTSNDTTSQSIYGIKESVIKDTNILDEIQAQAISDAETSLLKDPETKGTTDSFLMPTIKPGEMIYVISKTQEVHARYRVINYTFKFPEQTMETSYAKETTIPQLFKDRQIQTLKQEAIVNPFGMTQSFNMSFDDESKIDSDSSTNVAVAEGMLKVSTGSDGTMVSTSKTTPITVTSVHLKVVAESASTVVYSVSADGGANFQEITPEVETVITNQGTSLKLRVELDNASTLIDAIAVLYK